MSNYNIVTASSQEKDFHFFLNKLKSTCNWQSSLYSASSIAYYRQRAADNEWQSIDLSYILSLDDEPFFAFIGSLNIKGQIRKISLHEQPSIFIEANRLSRSCKKKIQSTVNSQLLQYECDINIIDYLHNEKLSYASEHLIRERACLMDLQFRRTIDLRQDESTIKAGVRKSFCSLINWGKREMDIEIHTKENISLPIINEFETLHVQESGRKTRSRLTWLRQYEAVLKGEAFCITAKYNKALVSAGYFTIDSGHCYYGVSASKRALFEKPLFHAIMWEALLYAKNSGAIIFEIGLDYPLHFKTSGLVTEKEVDIAKFKSGFGGRLKPTINITA